MNDPFGCCGTYGSRPAVVPTAAACMPFNAPLAEGLEFGTPVPVAGDPWACACVVWAGAFWDENFELMLVIQEFRREPFFESAGGARPPFFSALPRLSNAGRLGVVFCGGGGVVGTDAGAGGGGVCLVGVACDDGSLWWRCL